MDRMREKVVGYRGREDEWLELGRRWIDRGREKMDRQRKGEDG